jgi:glycosyltransferase involved in cell wall biosynthesis
MPKVLVNLMQTTGTKGGIEVYIQELYRHIGQQQHDFEFIGYGSSELLKQDTSWFPGDIVNSHISGENRLTWAFSELIAVGSQAQKINADLIHGPAMFSPLFPPCPVVTTFHDLLYFSHPHLMKSKHLTIPVRWMEKIAAKKSDRIITISHESKRNLEHFLHVRSDIIDITPLAARTTISSKKMPTSDRSSGLFLSIGQRSPYKDFASIINAWALIPPPQRPQLIITGSHGKDPLVKIVRENNLEEWITLKTWVSDKELSELFDRATAIIDPTLAAGFGLPALEAMSVGLPTLVTDINVFREVAGDASLYFSAFDSQALAQQVMKLDMDAQLRSELSNLGRQQAQKYSWKTTAELTLLSFTRALEESEGN